MKVWTQNEHTTLISLLEDGVMIDTLCEAIPTRTEAAIVTRARNKSIGLNFRTSGRDRKLYQGVSRREHRKNANDVNAERIIGEKRTAINSSTPTTSERTNQNISDVIVADNAQNINRDALKHIYEDVTKLLHSEHYQQIESITVTMKNTVLTVSRGVS